jgi:gamma-glutamyltranspeptidase/glutathione hydrolase
MIPSRLGERYMISAGHPLVAQIARDVLERGGTAVDAGVAAGLACNVVQPDQCNFGGVAPILVRLARSGEVCSISGVGPWSRAVDIPEYLQRYPTTRPLGAPCAVVPAAPDAWITALSRFGTMSLGAVAQGAIDLALGGFPMDRSLAASLAQMGEGFRHWPSTAAAYWPQGRAPREGERLVQVELGRLLQTIVAAEQGSSRVAALEAARRAFYQGLVADRIVAWVNENGGWMTLDDLADFRCDVTLAPGTAYRDWRVFTGDMVCQGPVLLQCLQILCGYDLRDLGHNSADYLHLLAETLKLGFGERERHLCDPAFTAVTTADLLAPNRIAALREAIRMEAALPDLASVDVPPIGRCHRDTTGFAIVDAAGNAFSCSPSDTIDGCPIVPGVGIIVSPRGLQSRLDPAHPACLRPSKRPRMTASPAMALADDGRLMAFNAPGGDVIVQAELQGFLNVVEFAMAPQEAIEAPRIASFAFPDSFHPHAHEHGCLRVEDRIAADIRAQLGQRGHRVATWPDFAFDAGGMNIVALTAPGPSLLAGGADPRRGNVALGR